MPENPMLWALGAGVVGAGLTVVAKLYGFFFMNGPSKHRVGQAMNVDRAEVREWANGEGYVDAGGELWRATSKDTLKPGDHVTVAAMDGLVLRVVKNSP
ncbi:MAG: NfeD family protein [Pseudomonadota bacterium]